VPSIERRLTFVFGRLIVLLVLLAVFFAEALTGWYLGTAIVGAIAVATPVAWHVIQRYWKRDRGLRFGKFGMTVALVVVWLIIFGVCFFFFYFPSSVWPARI